MKFIFDFLVLFRRERRPGDLVFALGFFVFSLIAAAVLPGQAKFLGNKSLVAEPGFWPSVGVMMMVGFGAMHLIGSYNSPRLEGRLKEVTLWARSIEFAIWFICYVVVVPKIGYLPATVLMSVLLSVRLGYRSAVSLICSVTFGVFVVVVFKTGLGVKIPAGEIYRFLPDSIRTFAMVNF